VIVGESDDDEGNDELVSQVWVPAGGQPWAAISNFVWLIVITFVCAEVWCTQRRAVYVVLIVCGAAFTITFPEFFEYVAVERSSRPAANASNASTADPPRTVLRPTLTEFGKSAGYQLGYTYVNQTLFTFLPLILLFVFNSLLVKAVLSAARLRQAMTGTNRMVSIQSRSRFLLDLSRQRYG